LIDSNVSQLNRTMGDNATLDASSRIVSDLINESNVADEVDKSIASVVSKVEYSQGQEAVSVGYQAGYYLQGENAVSVGYQAGYSGQGSNAVCVGANAGYFNQGLR
jgi:hypothetical protein